jgi:hypothetical protein
MVIPNLRVVQPKPPPSVSPVDARRNHQPVRLRFAVHVTQYRARRHTRGAGLRVDMHRFHLRQVQHHRIIGHRMPCNLVPA